MCCSIVLCQWWKFGNRVVTCVKYAGWLKLGSGWFWLLRGIWTCQDPHTTGPATTLCGRLPSRVRTKKKKKPKLNLCVKFCWSCVFASVNCFQRNVINRTIQIYVLFSVQPQGGSKHSCFCIIDAPSHEAHRLYCTLYYILGTFLW